MRGRTTFFVLCAAVLLVAGAAWGAREPQGGLELNVGVDESKIVEQVKTIPITKRPGQAKRVVASLSPQRLGAVEAGDTVEGFAEIEVSVTCLESLPQCVGKRYGYSPDTRTQLVLARSGKARRGHEVGRTVRLECSQQLPDRNHHCRVVLHGRETIRAGQGPGCKPCHLNVVMSAYHREAKGGQVLVVGGDSDDGISQGKAALSSAVFSAPPDQFEHSSPGPGRPIRKALPVVPHGHDTEEEVIHSVRLDDLQRGEALLVDATARVSISGLAYNVLLQPELIVAESPRSPEFTGVAVQALTNNGKVANQNGSNCTLGKSDFSNPCRIRKVGAARVIEDARGDSGAFRPLYLNLVMAARQEYGGSWHGGDRVRVLGARIDVRRYGSQYARQRGS